MQADEGEKLQAAKAVAAKFNCIAAVTGQVDYVSNGKQVLVLNGGNEMLKKLPAQAALPQHCAPAVLPLPKII